MDISTYEATGATNAADDIARRMRVADTSSRVTIAANEDLGGGMKAGMYCETGINIDNASYTGQADTPNANTTTWCSREGRLYIGNAMGEIRLGRQNVWWTQGALNPVGANLLGSDTLTNLINGGVGVYTVRGENQVKLLGGAALGAFAGSEVYWGYMGTSGMDFTTTGVTGESSVARNGKYNGFKLNYAQGAWLGMIDYQSSVNSPTSAGALLGGAAGSVAAANAVTTNANGYKRNSTKYGLGYKYAGASSESVISVQYWNKSRTNMAAGSAENKDGGYGITLNHDLGGGKVLVAQWGKANKRSYSDATAQTENGATGYTLGGLQRLSKRTHVYAAYHVIKNGETGTFNMAGGNYASAAGIGAGADVKMMALGLQHNF